jgi:hypothetical protein
MARKRRTKPAMFTKEYFQDQGRKGGLTGGALRWQGVSPAERTRIAKLAVAAREAKRAQRARAKLPKK